MTMVEFIPDFSEPRIERDRIKAAILPLPKLPMSSE